MKTKNILLSALILFVFAVLWNGVLHMIVLKDINALVDGIKRENLNDMMGLSLVMTAMLTFLFSFGYSKTRKNGKIKEGMKYGLFFGLLAVLLVDLNQYILYPIPVKVIASWSIGGLLEFTIYGIMISLINPTKNEKK